MSATAGEKARLCAAMVIVGSVAIVGAFVLVGLGPSRVRATLDAFQVFRQSAADAVLAGVPWPVLARPLATWTRGVLLAPHLFIPLAFILLAEWVIPAMKDQRILSPALLNDFLWYLAEIGLVLVVNAWVAESLRDVYQRTLGLPTIGAIAGMPAWLGFALAVLVSDFLAWVHHFVRHKVPVFWSFHTVHHAQRELNAWTNERVHLVDYLVATLLVFVPATALGVSPPSMMSYVILAGWYTRVYHANIRTNFGLMRFVLVTPQSHRVHHSIRPEHRDKNFGVIFSVWDHVCGTQCREYDVYPETGIHDSAFPQERRWADTLSLRPFLAQQIYPLRLFAQQLRDGVKR
jgi:sterol desaturase/sphingolipid hydroxylase (fatty acid hydroxylase superfamily)